MSTIRTNHWATEASSEALRARIAQAGATSQAQASQVSVSTQSIGEAAAAASVVYRQRQNEVPADNTYVHLDAWVDPSLESTEQINSRNANMTRIGRQVDNTFNAMNGVYKQFKQSLERTSPDLAKRDFGFTLDPQGDLVATGVSGQEKTRLTQLLNESPQLQELASQFARSLKDWAQADHIRGFGKYKLDAQTFQHTIDIGEALDARNGNNNKMPWFFQLDRKGTLDYEKIEAMKPYKAW